MFCLCLFGFVFCSFQARAQEATETPEKVRKPLPPITHQIGLGTAFVLDRLLRSEQDSVFKNPYLLTYRLGVANWGLRLGIGGDRKYRRETEGGFADSRTTTNRNLNVRAGLDYQWHLGRKFYGNIGLDGIYKSTFDQKVEDSGFDVLEIIQQSESFGGGPVFGFQYLFTKRFGIYTEAAFYFLKGTRDNGRLFKNFPELNDQLFHEETEEIITLLPSTVFLIYKF